MSMLPWSSVLLRGRERSAFFRYGMAILSVGLGLLAGLWLRPYSYRSPYLFFYAPILFSLLSGGLEAGIASTILSALAVNYFFFSPHGHFSFDPVSIFSGVYFCLSFGFISWLIDVRWNRAEGERRESEERLRLFVEHAPAALAMFDREMRYLHASRRWRADYDLGDHDLRGVSHYEIFPEVPEHWRQAHRRALTGEVLHEENGRFDRADGSVQWIRWEIRPWQDRTGGIGGIVIFADDITERKRAGDARERLAAVVDSSDDAIIAKTLDGTIIAWNSGAEKVFGYSAAEAVGKPILMLLPPERTSEEADILARIRQGESVQHFETVRIRKDSQRIEVSVTISPIRDSSGAIVGVSKIARDITERKRAEQLLRESDRNYRTLFESMDEGFCTIEVLFNENNCPVDYRFLEVNPVFEKLTGIPNARGRRMREIAPNHEQYWFEIYGKVALTGESTRFENRAEQLHRWFEVHAFRVGEPQERKVAIFFDDITERKLSEEALHKSEERFSKAFRNNPLAISISTEAEGRYLDVNDAFLELLGYQRKDVIGHTATELQFWGEPLDRMEILRELKEEKRISKHHTRYRTAKGEIREAEVWMESIELEGQRCLLGITRDVTEMQQLEAQFRQAQKMEAVGRLAGGVAHDFNNILGIIMGYSDIALGEIAAESPASRYVSETKKAAKRGAMLTQQLLAFSRKQVVFPKVLDLNDVVQNATKMFLRLVGEDIAVEFRPGVPLGGIKADPGQIEQILMNLVVNARDAMPTGGKIIIETGHAEIDEAYVSRHAGAHAGLYVVLVVSDTGCGMDETTRSKIFEPFFTTKEVGKGTGLGLSTVYGIVKQSEGYVAAYSEPGKGTTFKIYFPMVGEKGKKLAVDLEDAEPPQGSETILVVEDEKNLREVTVTLLQQGGYRVLEAKDAKDALEVMANSEQGIDLLLTDVVMPEKSGAELVREARERHPKLRCLFMSGYTGDLVTRQGVVIEETSFLEKPFTKRALLMKVYSILHGQPARGNQ
jgi:PAS domain S-box-containing protein